MNEYNVKVLFEQKRIITNLDKLVQNDYNSIKLNFTFDKTGSRVLFKLKYPDDTEYIDEIVNNELIFGQGILNQSGYYKYEISLYGSDSKLTDYAIGEFYVRNELINTDEIVIPDDRVPVLDNLINEVDNIDIDVSKSGTTATVEITKKDGTTKTVDIEDGQTGPIGVTPNIHIGNVSSGSTPNVSRRGTDANPIFDFTLQPGYTPQKGIDYYTNQEKEEMIDYIVDNANSEFNQNVNNKTTAFNTNASNKTDAYNSNHTDKMGTYNQNATDKTSAFNTNASEKTTAYDNNASSKLTTYNDNATEKLSAYNTNHTEKLTAYNDNASDKLDEYNDNAQEKIDEFNENKEELQREVDYYKSTLNALPKVEGEGTSLTLDETAEAPMPMTLSPSALEQASTTGKNLANIDEALRSNILVKSGNNYIFTKTGDNARFSYNMNVNIPAGDVVFQVNSIQWNVTGGIQNYLGLALTYSDNSSETVQIWSTQILGVKFAKKTTTKTISKIQLYLDRDYDNNSNFVFNDFIVFYGTDSTTYEPYTGGIPAPNPDYPQDIHTISGDNEIKVENRNLLPNYEGNVVSNGITFTKNADGTYILNGQNNGNGHSAVMFVNTSRGDEPLNLPAGTYYGISTGYSGFNLVGFDGENYISLIKASTNSFTLNSDTTFQQMYIQVNKNTSTVFNNVKFYPIISDASVTVDTYTPHQEQSLPLNLPVENLFDKDSAVEGEINGSNGTISPSSSYVTSDFIPVIPNQNYYMSGKSTGVSNCFYDENKNFIQTINKTNGILPVPNNSNIRYLRLNMSVASKDTFQIEKGSIEHPYNEYGKALEYCKIGDYEDEFYLATASDTGLTAGKWYLKKNVGKVVLNGSEEWLAQTTTNPNYYRFASPIINQLVTKASSTTNIIDLFSYYFEKTSASLTYSNTNGIAVSTSGGLIIYDNVFKEYTLEQFKTWLSTHNTEVYYPLATQQYILLNNTLQSQLTEIYKWVKAYQEQTNISQVNNDLPFVIKASAIYDLSKLMTRVEVLESEV